VPNGSFDKLLMEGFETGFKDYWLQDGSKLCWMLKV
jgi:hypothetical protein